MNAVGIDVSKGKSTVAIMRPFGEIAASPREVIHTDSELSDLARILKNLDGETKVIMECIGSYHLSIAHALRDMGLMVCAVHAQLIHDFGNNTIALTAAPPFVIIGCTLIKSSSLKVSRSEFIADRPNVAAYSALTPLRGNPPACAATPL